MAVRPTMAALIARLRRSISDESAPAVFTDEALQEALDVHQTQARYLPLPGRQTYRPGGAVVWLDFYADRGDWEADVVLVDVGWNALTPATADLIVGHWTFTESQLAVIYLTGKCYDLNGAAADVLEAWAAKVKLKHDFQDVNVRLHRSQQHAMLLAQAAQYRAKQLVQCATVGRSDLGR